MKRKKELNQEFKNRMQAIKGYTYLKTLKKTCLIEINKKWN